MKVAKTKSDENIQQWDDFKKAINSALMEKTDVNLVKANVNKRNDNHAAIPSKKPGINRPTAFKELIVNADECVLTGDNSGIEFNNQQSVGINAGQLIECKVLYLS